MKNTRKKVKIVGSAEYINTQTQEVETMQVISMEDRDFNFHKIWLQHIIQSFDLIGNQKTKLAFWLISEMDSENKICYTLRQMADKSGISLETVRVTIKTLIDGEFLVKQNQGVYRVHPDRIFKGSGNNRMNVLLQYNQAKKETTETKKTKIKESIKEQPVINEQAAEAIEPEKKKECCHQCGAEKVEIQKKDGTTFIGCPNWKEHKKGA